MNKKKDISYEMIYKSAIFAIKTNCKAKIFIYNFLFIPPFLCKAGNNVAQEKKEDKKNFQKLKIKIPFQNERIAFLKFFRSQDWPTFQMANNKIIKGGRSVTFHYLFFTFFN